ncbi:MBL fold metallo-hydrolase [Legionella israelensis]|uniref:MBL fold metallo-hydrolase n=1 Tax=Legionella israelensis TaxID=454 RepID=A0A0W0V1Y6_9GAMM|nr:MBL fold metallo-hydrolase [Legionella israelensis]KTD14104.1 metallo-beta-lactamase family transporter protein [Legionella israelensis]QBR84802.1 MBL fold metallo-hydrolase [Legionella israelensis]QBS10332.1 MBL fold metallo-hydrolase [Legionella israelensis]SCY34481.1 hydroxyacylglutathione hydrolase [Legionella israelensis DSM 19235]STX59932.1 hydroxyacylglutathione hydrolase [Legionella israelensis]
MFIEQFYDEGLAHLSYIIGDEDKAIVIDPHQDVGDYLDLALRKKVRITHIFETHRNEDYVIGSRSLAEQTNAKIYHGNQLDFKYGNSVKENDEFQFSNILIKVLETPGHTPESISLVLYNTTSSDSPFAVFTGDVLFVGAVGRTDLWKSRKEAAGFLYDSIYQKLLPLGDHVLIYPAHGAGSVCGEGMGTHDFSTIGYEKSYNKSLQKLSKEEFIKDQCSRQFEHPPYFEEMEKRNLRGPEILNSVPHPRRLNVEEVVKNKSAQLVDVRPPEGYAGVSIPNSIAIPHDMISKFSGWFLDYEKDIILISENEEDMESAVIQLVRLGYTRIKGWLPGIHAWEITGKEYWHFPVVHAQEIKKRLEKNKQFILLDVRADNEWNEGHLPGAKHIYLSDLPEHIKELPQDSVITTFCGSGRRATIAASLLKQRNFKQVEICFGSMAACKAIGCPIE